MTLNEKWSQLEVKLHDSLMKAITIGMAFENMMPV